MLTDRPAISTLEAIYRRRATRAFAPTDVDETTIRLLLRAAVHAPTAMHLEPWAFVVVQDRALLKKISDRAKTLIAAPQGSAHRELARRPSTPHLPAIFTDPAFNIFYDAGTLIVICGKPTSTFVMADCWLAAENLMLAATAIGLATCPIGFALLALNDREVKAELDIPPEVTPFAPIIVGVSAVTTPQAPARREPEILSWKRGA
jgi:nitroreductase